MGSHPIPRDSQVIPFRPLGIPVASRSSSRIPGGISVDTSFSILNVVCSSPRSCTEQHSEEHSIVVVGNHFSKGTPRSKIPACCCPSRQYPREPIFSDYWISCMSQSKVLETISTSTHCFLVPMLSPADERFSALLTLPTVTIHVHNTIMR